MTDDEKTEVPVAPRDQSQVEDSDRLSLKAKSINNDHEVLESRTSMKDYTDRDIESAEQAIQPPEPPYSVYSHREKASMILLVSFAAIISPLSGAVYLPILPSLARDLDISTSLINLTVTTYLVRLQLPTNLIKVTNDTPTPGSTRCRTILHRQLIRCIRASSSLHDLLHRVSRG